MPDKESTKSKDESLRQIVEKNLAKEKTDQKESRLDKLRVARDKRKEDARQAERGLLRRFFSKFRFLTSPFSEIRLVTWPNRKVTLRLTFAVVIFATIFGIMVSLLDWGFEIIFKKVFLHG
jgi:preprotein translocase SecE subunit